MGHRGKVLGLSEAVEKYVHDGAVISFGGFSSTQCPMAAVHEIIRHRIKNLHVVAASNGQAVDELIGGGCVEGIEIAYGGNGRFASTCIRFRRAAERGEIKVEDYSNYQMSLRFMAGAMGVPFLPTYSSLGTDIVKKWGYDEEERRQNPRLAPKKLHILDNPFNVTGQVDQLVLVPALRPDITIIHAPRADIWGNVQLMGLQFADLEQAKASKNLIVTCEEIVETEELRKDPYRNQILSFQVSAVVEVPWGAYPCAVFGYYDYDPWFLRDLYQKVAKNESEWQNYLDKYVYGTKDRQEFLDLIGMDRLKTLVADKEAGYNPGLNRR
ncbi:MAG: CoA transferase subunit A [Syntrophobacteraceae bacterium]